MYIHHRHRQTQSNEKRATTRLLAICLKLNERPINQSINQSVNFYFINSTYERNTNRPYQLNNVDRTVMLDSYNDWFYNCLKHISSRLVE